MAYTREDAVAFIEAMRMTVEGKVGFKWMTAKLELLGAYVDELAAENERVHAYLDATGTRADFDAFAAQAGRE